MPTSDEPVVAGASGIALTGWSGGTGGGALDLVPVAYDFGDTDLTIYDLIENDADIAVEVLARVEEARHDAVAAQKLYTHLAKLLVEINRLKIPGSLRRHALRLMENATEIRKNALALEKALPQASESIATAGKQAAWRHQELADLTRDHGHAAPAERDYHQE
ncbi:hypothetical protein [Streptomyces sp. NRRL S-87]|uniref:hypothetical protein n=1 Tax=Streptomyces sp. NRRL S-87 TaxID=1463920 RepID=UPI0004C07E36|nr:hypothetical protein [Streptomyces sp. NRRL S-87]